MPIRFSTPPTAPVPQATCLDCGYRLTGLSRRNCPECGRAFDPADPTTYRGSRRAALWHRLARPPTRIECWLLALLTVLGLLEVSANDGLTVLFIGTFLCGLPTAFLLVAAAVIRGLCVALDTSRTSSDGPTRRRHIGRWFVAPMCVLLVASCAVYPWPLWVRFKLSQSAFEEAVTRFRENGDARPRWIGLYRIEGISSGRDARSTYFTTGHNIIDPIGFVHDPPPGPETAPRPTTWLTPQWYTFEE